MRDPEFDHPKFDKQLRSAFEVEVVARDDFEQKLQRTSALEVTGVDEVAPSSWIMVVVRVAISLLERINYGLIGYRDVRSIASSQHEHSGSRYTRVET